MKFDFVVFGATGLQGRICARDLLNSGYKVLLCGRDASGVTFLLKNKNAKFQNLDLRNYKDVVKIITLSGAKVVVNCAELTYNIQVMKVCLEAKKSLTDLGGLQKITKEQFKLHNAFRENNLICITGCGSTPGISNVMASYAVRAFDSIETINLGFAWDSNIKKFVVPYSMQSIFEEFTSSPILYHNGRFIKENRARCVGTRNFKGIGEQTAYCIVHSEVYTFARYFKNNGLKNVNYFAGFPEHSIRVIKALIETGFNSNNEINIAGERIKPAEFTLNVLKKIRMPAGYKETENIWVEVEGLKKGKKKKVEMNCIVKTISGWEEAGSNVDTGRTISIISQMIQTGLIKESGVYSPEAVIPCETFFEELAKRKMWVYMNEKPIN